MGLLLETAFSNLHVLTVDRNATAQRLCSLSLRAHCFEVFSVTIVKSQSHPEVPKILKNPSRGTGIVMSFSLVFVIQIYFKNWKKKDELCYYNYYSRGRE